MILVGKTRNGAYAEAEYNEDIFVVKAGGKINMAPAAYLRKNGRAAKYRNNREYVDSEGNILKDCEFKRPSTAAEFVSGRSVNGMLFWKVAFKMSLKKYMEG